MCDNQLFITGLRQTAGFAILNNLYVEFYKRGDFIKLWSVCVHVSVCHCSSDDFSFVCKCGDSTFDRLTFKMLLV